jgi:2-polyprenyl-6-methoxyphenol hydroxylase-like FAD-dependent oxidoreductase
LCDALADRPAGEDVGARAALRRYERERRLGNGLVATMVDGLDRLLTGAPGIGGRLAREGMAQVARNLWLRRWFAAQAMGTQGPLPRAARAP